ncbi:zf-HC2 domain-containing protein [Microbulbifer thermotolerans]|uniref:zf-HC2 domain-containing protein n=1 Tax=Microbulbifer thermotolerans TaxID=252514 RepID=UPI00224ACAC0|nr:zf-HC2 domain-containing protein [Microbulbifer thermotolerans]MCX2840116.1 zf-HC2 domain-containing protein [Microbulbifer thermotolerans]
MKKCRDITRLLSEAQERELTPSERISVKLHTLICSGCRNFGSQVDILRGISRAYVRGAADEPQREEDSGG